MTGELWAVKADAYPGVFTLGGRILVHPNRTELEFMFPGRTAVDVSRTTMPVMRWKDHPQWPLLPPGPFRREDFR
jgi:hypothetical protein